MAIEIVSFPIKNGGSSHGYVTNYQRVSPMADSAIISPRPEVDNVELSRRLMECRDWIGCYRGPWLPRRPFHHAEVKPRSWERSETLLYLGLPRYFLTMVNQNLHRHWDITIRFFAYDCVVWKLSAWHFFSGYPVVRREIRSQWGIHTRWCPPSYKLVYNPINYIYIYIYH